MQFDVHGVAHDRRLGAPARCVYPLYDQCKRLNGVHRTAPHFSKAHDEKEVVSKRRSVATPSRLQVLRQPGAWLSSEPIAGFVHRSSVWASARYKWKLAGRGKRRLDLSIEATARHHGLNSIVPQLSDAGDFRPRLAALGDEELVQLFSSELCELDTASLRVIFACGSAIVVDVGVVPVT